MESATLVNYPTAKFVLDELGKQMLFLLKATREAPCSPLDKRLDSLELIASRLSSLYGNNQQWVPQVVRSYVMLSLEFLNLQRRLEESGRYLLSSEREALEQVYQNKDVFGAYYLSGLLLSEALWPNHHKLGCAFTDSFLTLLSSKSKVLEVGVGTGFHLYHLKNRRPDIAYEGVDISDYAIEFARKFAFGDKERLPGNYSFYRQDATKGLDCRDETYDAVILGEVLEHVEDPESLLKEMARVARKISPMFITTVVFAANIDHIYLFEKADDIRKLFTKTPWDVEREWVLPIYPEDTPEMEKRPMNYGAILRKR
jgi:SAM-dependent methyltransferase